MLTFEQVSGGARLVLATTLGADLSVAGDYRPAPAVEDTRTATEDLVNAGARLIAPPTVTPWATLNSRLEAPAGLQLTLFGPAPDDP